MGNGSDALVPMVSSRVSELSLERTKKTGQEDSSVCGNSYRKVALQSLTAPRFSLAVAVRQRSEIIMAFLRDSPIRLSPPLNAYTYPADIEHPHFFLSCARRRRRLVVNRRSGIVVGRALLNRVRTSNDGGGGSYCIVSQSVNRALCRSVAVAVVVVVLVILLD